MQNKIMYLAALIAAAPLSCTIQMPQPITPCMINKAACEVAAEYKKSKHVRAAFATAATAVLGTGLYFMTSKTEPTMSVVPATPEGIAKALEKLLANKPAPSSDGWFGTIKGLAQGMVAFLVLNQTWSIMQNWLLGPQYYCTIKTFIDAKTYFNPLKNAMVKEANFRNGNLATANDLTEYSNFYDMLFKEVVKICGYMQFRIATYKKAAPSADLELFTSVLQNVVAITTSLNNQMQPFFTASTTTVDDFVQALAQYASRIDIEFDLFQSYEAIWEKNGGFFE